MRLPTACRIFTVIVGCAFSLSVMAQLEENNGTQIAAIAGGGELINKAISKQTTSQTKTDLLAGEIGTEFLYIKGWEGKYNSYLKTTQGYAEGLKGTAMLYAEGVTTLRHLYEIAKAIKNNPQGVMATVSMNNLYADAAAELIKVYNVLKYTISVGGKTNMLTGAAGMVDRNHGEIARQAYKRWVKAQTTYRNYH